MAAQTWKESHYGAWGPITATLDWCEANYQFSHYIAEMANAFSNVFSIGLALHGYLKAQGEFLPTRYSLAFAGFALIGVGSFAFHATLLFQAQLADELPMIYLATYSNALLFDTTSPGFGIESARTKALITAAIAFDVLFSWFYYLYRNPVFHQVIFATLVFIIIFRVTFLLRWSERSDSVPPATRSMIARLFRNGCAIFALGFFVWNLDNIFCDSLTRWKASIGWPIAFLLEGHSWWHILTATGAYLQFIGIAYLTLCVKDDHRNYAIGYTFGLPYIKRTGQRRSLD